MGLLKRLLGREDEPSPTDASAFQSQPVVAPAGTPQSPVRVSRNVTVRANARVLQGDEAQQMVQAIEAATGMDLDGDGRVGGAAVPPQTGPPPLAPPPVQLDTTSELERLAALHAAGALTDEEFAAAKARALGQSG